jgi:hypothetical protein
LVHQNSVNLRVLDISREIGANAGTTSLLEMIVNPTQQNLLRGQSHEVSKRLTIMKQHDQFGAVPQRNICHETDLDDLPEEAQNKVRLALDEILRSNVDNLTTDAFARINCQVLILSNFVLILGLDVEGLLKDGSRHSAVDDFAQHNTISHGFEERLIVGVDWQGDVFVSS